MEPTFAAPITGDYRISSPYGPRDAIQGAPGASRFHYGVDLAHPTPGMGGQFAGTPVVAPSGGRVAGIYDNTGSEGYGVVIEHPDGRESHLLHMASEPLVRVGDTIEQGQQVGAVGSTGVSSGPHLDWRVRENGEWLDPQTLLGQASALPTRDIGPTPTDALLPGAVSAAANDAPLLPQETNMELLQADAAGGNRGGLGGLLNFGEPNMALLMAGAQMLANSGPSLAPRSAFEGVPQALALGQQLGQGPEAERGVVVNDRLVNPVTGELIADFSEAPGNDLFTGAGVNAEALNAMVQNGQMTPEQAYNWALGRVVTTPDGQMTFITPRDIGFAGGMPPGAAAPVGAVDSSPLLPTSPASGTAAPGVTIGGTRPPDGSERNTAAFYNRAVAALGEMGQAGGEGVSLGDFLTGNVPLVGNYLVSPEYQAFRNAGENFVTAVLRQESGAAITEAEMDRAFQQYFPQPGDGPETIAQKARLREQAVRTLYEGSGRAQPGLTPPDDVFAAPAQPDAPQQSLLPAEPGDYPDWSSMNGAELGQWLSENEARLLEIHANEPEVWAAIRRRVAEIEGTP